MVQRIDEIQRVSDSDGTQVAKRTRVVEEDGDVAYIENNATESLAERIVWFIAGALLILLAFRFTLAMLGANPSNAFANFIYELSHPFVAPFFSLFGYNLQYGVSRFEIFTLVAMAVYAVIAYGLARLINLVTDHGHSRHAYH